MKSERNHPKIKHLPSSLKKSDVSYKLQHNNIDLSIPNSKSFL